MILIIIDNHIYEVSEFVKHHPGEGILNEYLRDYRNKNATEQFNRFHFTNEADELLLESKEGTANGIYYVGPSFWKDKIPPYYLFFKNPLVEAPIFLSADENRTFLMTNKSDLSLRLFYKKNGKVENVDLNLDETKHEWSVTFQNKLYSDKKLDNLIKKVMVDPSRPGAAMLNKKSKI